jgi:formamidopyrimidine-DNA glycosylase
MPELPEVETMRRRIAPVVGCRIDNLKRPRSPLQSILISPRLSALCRRVKGRAILDVSRLGKRIILELDNDDRIVIEPRMTGLVLLDNAPNKKHLRLIFELSRNTNNSPPSSSGRRARRMPGGEGKSDTPLSLLGRGAGGEGRRLLFWDQRGLGVVSLLSPRQFQEEFGTGRIGPDALQITPELLKERLGQSRRAIKVALLDQHALAGIGNLYASEILHRAGIHPAKHCDELKPRHWSAIHVAMQEVLEEAIRHQGSTLRDGTYRASTEEAGNYQDKHRVYQRAGQRCMQCRKAEIVRIVQAQRSTFFCPVCQK